MTPADLFNPGFTPGRPEPTAESPVPAQPPSDVIWIWGLLALSRVGLVLAAMFAALVGAATAVTATLSILALVVVVERLARTRGRSAADAALAGVGGVLAAGVLVGLLLDVTRIGLRPWTWTVALGLLAVAGLVVAEHRSPATRRRPDWMRLPSWPGLAWGLAAAAVLVLALVVSGRAGAPVVQVLHRPPVAAEPVQMSFGPIAKTSATIVISAAHPTGRLELNTQAADGTSISYPLMSVRPGKPVTTSVVLPVSGRFVITLNDPTQTAPLRSLILDR